MKRKVDYLLIGTGVAPLLAAQRLANRGDSVAILNPDHDFFLENSELPLDLLSFETTNADISLRFSNNLPEKIYRDLIPEFPGAIELWKEEDQSKNDRAFQVESAPWIRFRHRLWVRFQLATGLPATLEVGRAVLHFWTPKMERNLRQNLEKHQPRLLGSFDQSVTKQPWEEWDILSRDPVAANVVAHLESIRVWSHGDGEPPHDGWNRIKLMRRAQADSFLGEQSFQDLSKVLFRFLGWERCTVRGMSPRVFYRWNKTAPLEFDADGVRSVVILACDGPIHWIASQVRHTIDGV